MSKEIFIVQDDTFVENKIKITDEDRKLAEELYQKMPKPIYQ